MDLSHWDLVDRFTMWEAACLACGFDPNLEIPPPAEHAKAIFIFQHMETAYGAAETILRLCGPDPLSPDETIYSMFPDFALPSMQLERLAKNWIRAGTECDFNWKQFNEDSTKGFSRKALDEWFSRKGISSAYRFVLSPKSPESGPPVTVSQPITKTERNTLLTIIAALCNYSAIKPHERGAASQIAKMTEEIGATVTDDTIRKVLARIPDALETRMK